MTNVITWPLYSNGQTGKVDRKCLICYNYKMINRSIANMDKEITHDLRSFRFIGEEAEALGNRLDSARLILESARSPWARRYWQQVIDRLLFQWRSLPALHDGDATISVIPRWTVDYDFFEIDHSPGEYNITDQIFDEIFRTSLDKSWDRAREARLARAQY